MAESRIFFMFITFLIPLQGQCKPSAIELAQIAEAPPVLADDC
jgi:hypothetical protein